jgi:hypothetical protein
MTDLVLQHPLDCRYALTTERAESSYGVPVLVDKDCQTYGPGDIISIRTLTIVSPALWIAAELVRVAANRDLSVGVGHPLVKRFIVAGGT